MKIRVLALLLTASSLCAAQASPTRAEFHRLTAQKEKMTKLQEKITRLQTEQIFAFGQFQQMCREIATSHRWSPTMQCDVQSLTFADRPVAPALAQPAAAPPTPLSMQNAKPGDLTPQK
jgi:hypothetical protein